MDHPGETTAAAEIETEAVDVVELDAEHDAEAQTSCVVRYGCAATFAHDAKVRCVAALPRGRIVSGVHDGTLRFWDLGVRRCYQILDGGDEEIYSMAVLGNGCLVAGFYFWDEDDDNVLPIDPIVWDTANGDVRARLIGHGDDVMSLLAIPGDRVVSGNADGTLKLWEATGRCLRTLTGNHQESIMCLAVLADARHVVSSEARYVVSGSLDHTLKLWNLASGCVNTLDVPYGVGCVAALPNGNIIYDADHTLMVSDPCGPRNPGRRPGGHCVQTLVGHSKTVLSVAVLSHDRACSGAWDHLIKIWRLTDSCCLQTLAGHESGVFDLATLPDGRIASASWDTTVKVWTDCQRASEKRLAKAVSRQRARCEDVARVIALFL